ncbi:MAG: trypsin-like peptidase domain-containing protein, partial [Chroococcidiopsidaceae cyanobacterium CP_BM_RX_35]|nr:trypsin-like peptidase domain-containing protein [Chroococcidiopsidaceae cyanobacterium CP_BM_RX_35]
LKQLAFSLTLLAIGGGAGWFSSRYFPPQKHSMTRITAVPMALTPAPERNYTSRDITSRGRTTERSDLNFIALAVKKVGPAVVRIDAMRKVESHIPEAFNNPLFRPFFGSERPIPEERRERGTGSGFILSPDGRLLTNAHVVAAADTVRVLLSDGRSFEAKVLGTDQVTDVAVVKIPAMGLPTVKLGSSKKLVPGEWAIAIGNPLGLDNTVTAGIISATERSSAEVGDPDQRVSFIQTNAAINPGNSGGPLLNAQGEVVGINTATQINAQGLAFAIPIETAMHVANQLFAKGHVEHPFLGIQMVDLTATAKDELNQEEPNLHLKQETGVLILQVVEKSPSDRAGLKKGDILQKINGMPVKKSAEVQDQVESSAIGSVLHIEVNRQGLNLTLTVKPGAFPTNDMG